MAAAGLTAGAQEYEILSFTDTLEVPDVSARYIYVRYVEWLENNYKEFGLSSSPKMPSESDGAFRCSNYGSMRADFRFRLIPRHPLVNFDIYILCEDGSLRVGLTKIVWVFNAGIGPLCGENGKLYFDLYSRRDYKFGMKIVKAVSEYFDRMCESMEEGLARPSKFEPSFLKESK